MYCSCKSKNIYFSLSKHIFILTFLGLILFIKNNLSITFARYVVDLQTLIHSWSEIDKTRSRLLKNKIQIKILFRLKIEHMTVHGHVAVDEHMALYEHVDVHELVAVHEHWFIF